MQIWAGSQGLEALSEYCSKTLRGLATASSGLVPTARHDQRSAYMLARFHILDEGTRRSGHELTALLGLPVPRGARSTRCVQKVFGRRSLITRFSWGVREKALAMGTKGQATNTCVPATVKVEEPPAQPAPGRTPDTLTPPGPRSILRTSCMRRTSSWSFSTIFWKSLRWPPRKRVMTGSADLGLRMVWRKASANSAVNHVSAR
mmetsp:Transcript_2299/g.6514  ORF Transcript_2299/g.6514 Transcript_2299/m.6514 type:complete len:204 (+) Transcript_2299:345-956(+)